MRWGIILLAAAAAAPYDFITEHGCEVLRPRNGDVLVASADGAPGGGATSARISAMRFASSFTPSSTARRKNSLSSSDIGPEGDAVVPSLCVSDHLSSPVHRGIVAILSVCVFSSLLARSVGARRRQKNWIWDPQTGGTFRSS